MKRIIKIAEGDSFTRNGAMVFMGGGTVNDGFRFKDATIEIDEYGLNFNATRIFMVIIDINKNRLYGKQELLDLGVRETDMYFKFSVVKSKIKGHKNYLIQYKLTGYGMFENHYYPIYHPSKLRFAPIKIITSQPFTICGDYEEVAIDS